MGEETGGGAHMPQSRLSGKALAGTQKQVAPAAPGRRTGGRGTAWIYSLVWSSVYQHVQVVVDTAWKQGPRS